MSILCQSVLPGKTSATLGTAVKCMAGALGTIHQPVLLMHEGLLMHISYSPHWHALSYSRSCAP